MIPNRYLTAPLAVPNFDYTDIADGTGVVIFYPFVARITGDSRTRWMGRNTLASDFVEDSYSGSNNLDFDTTTFNKPRVVRGTGFVTFSASMTGGGNTTWTLTLYKVASGGSETSIGTANGNTLNSGGSDSFCVPLTLTQTTIAVGEKLRFSLDLNATTGTVTVGLDPLNRAGTVLTSPSTLPTRMEVHVPFKLDI